jgi:hypothetical protein
MRLPLSLLITPNNQFASSQPSFGASPLLLRPFPQREFLSFFLEFFSLAARSVPNKEMKVNIVREQKISLGGSVSEALKEKEKENHPLSVLIFPFACNQIFLSLSEYKGPRSLEQ